MNYSKKVVVVTGGSQGIGKEIALAYGRENAIVNVFDINFDEAEKVCQEIKSLGVESSAFYVNVILREDISDAVKSVITKYNRIDVLVNCAGVVNTKPFTDVTDDDWELIMNVNLRGVYYTCHEVIPFMMEQKYGKILNIASIAGKTGGGFFGNTIYGTSKAGVIGLTKGLAREGGPYGINVNAICPGATHTTMLDDLTDEARQNVINGIPLRKFARTKDIANVALFLTSDLAGHVSGEITDVDGGVMRD
ncbi:MAG: SDR family oxidoreductase [Clostridia bacterium]|nr:SDR family oxidoreductase [Clostridia bacterium]